MFIYLMETIAFGSIALVAATMLTELVPELPTREVIAVFGVGLIVFLLWRDSYERFEHILTLMACVLIFGILYSLVAISFPGGGEVATSFFDLLKHQSLITIMALMGAVGSGLNLLLYSVWLHEKIGDRHGESYFRAHMRSVNINLVLVFVIVGVFAFAFIAIGYAGLHGHGAGHHSLEEVLGGVVHVLSDLPYAPTVFLITGFFTLFGATMSGMDGRARAIASILRSTTAVDLEEKTLYRIILLVFAGIMLFVIFFGNPQAVIHHVSAAASIMFAVLGFLIIYLDSRLPVYARGSRKWLAVMGIGSIVFLGVALLQEEMYLTFGIPLLERLAVLGCVLYFLLKTNLIQRAIAGYLTPFDTAAVVVIFSLFSIYGTVRGIPFGDVIINFRDLGPIIAGLLGGPVAGLLTGLIGGAYRYSLGGWTALPCFAGTVAAGLIAGYFSSRWGAFTYLRFISLGILVEAVHLLVFVPLLTYPAPFADVIGIIRAVFLPMIVTNTLGLVFFLMMIRNQDAAGPFRAIDPAASIRRTVRHLKSGRLTAAEVGGLGILIALALVFLASLVWEPALVAVGIVLMERIAVIGFVAFLLAQTALFRRLALGRPVTQDILWLTTIFGFISIYAMMGDLRFGDFVVTFRDLGPLLAGLLGGPIAGVLVGLFSGTYAFLFDEATSPLSVLGPVVAGILAGYASRRWRGRYTYLRLVFLGGLAACFSALLLAPSADGILEIAGAVLLPMFLANAAGLVVFISILRDRGVETVLSEDGASSAEIPPSPNEGTRDL